MENSTDVINATDLMQYMDPTTNHTISVTLMESVDNRSGILMPIIIVLVLAFIVVIIIIGLACRRRRNLKRRSDDIAEILTFYSRQDQDNMILTQSSETSRNIKCKPEQTSTDKFNLPSCTQSSDYTTQDMALIEESTYSNSAAILNTLKYKGIFSDNSRETAREEPSFPRNQTSAFQEGSELSLNSKFPESVSLTSNYSNGRSDEIADVVNLVDNEVNSEQHLNRDNQGGERQSELYVNRHDIDEFHVNVENYNESFVNVENNGESYDNVENYRESYVNEENDGEFCVDGEHEGEFSVNEENDGEFYVDGEHAGEFYVVVDNDGEFYVDGEHGGEFYVAGDNDGEFYVDGDNDVEFYVAGDNDVEFYVAGDNDGEFYVAGDNDGEFYVDGDNDGEFCVNEENKDDEIYENVQHTKEQDDKIECNTDVSSLVESELPGRNNYVNVKNSDTEFEDELEPYGNIHPHTYQGSYEYSSVEFSDDSDKTMTIATIPSWAESVLEVRDDTVYSSVEHVNNAPLMNVVFESELNTVYSHLHEVRSNVVNTYDVLLSKNLSREVP